MSKKIEQALGIIRQNAQESGNPHAFYSGMVFGLGHSAAFIKQAVEEDDIEMAYGYVMALLAVLDKEHFKENET